MHNERRQWAQPDICRKLHDLLADFDPQLIDAIELPLEQSALDSFAMLSFAVAIEREFQINFEAKDLEEFGKMSVNELVQKIFNVQKT